MIKRLLLAVAMLCAVTEAQVPVTPISQPRVTFVNAAGQPCAGCTLASFAAGTTTPLATYTDGSGISQNTNPIILDASGGAFIWLGTNSYKLILKDSLGNIIWSVDGVKAGQLLPCSSANAVQSANTAVNGLTCDPTITINTTTHTINVGTLPTNHVTIGAVSTPTSWTFDTTSPTSALNSIITVRYVNPSSAIDLITQINALFTNCSYVCEVHIPAGNYTVSSGTILINHATQSLTGDGKDKVRITYAGSNFLDWRFNSLTYDFNAAGEVSGFTVTCTSLSATCMTGGSTIGAKWHDINVYGPGGMANAGAAGTSQAFVFQNTFDWMERWSMVNVNIGGFATNIHFLAPSGGTDSFGYGLVNGVWTNQGAGTKGVVIDLGATVYNMLGFKYQFNLQNGGAGSEIFRIGGSFNGVGFDVTGENFSANYTFAHITTGLMLFHGDYKVFGPPSMGGIVIDTPQTTGQPIPFQIDAGLGAVYHMAGIPPLVNYDGSGESFTVTPVDIPDQTTNQVAARFGYLRSTTTGKSAFFDAFDINAKLCHFTRNSFTTDGNLVSAWCLDGTGNSTQSGYVGASGVRSISPIDLHSLMPSPVPTTMLSQTTDVFGGIKSWTSADGGFHSSYVQLVNSTLSCVSTLAGTFNYAAGGVGSKDTVQVCAKDAAGVYAWRTIY